MADINSKSLVNFLTCFLCGMQYRQPRLLCCLHSYCESCLNKYIEDFRKAAKDLKDPSKYNLTCPQCTTEVESLKVYGTQFTAEDFPRNFFTERLIQFEQWNGKHPANTGETDTEKPKMQNELPVTTKEETTNGTIVTCCERAGDQNGNESEHYCVDCNVTVCTICQITDHSRHRCATLQAVATNFSQKVTNPMQQVTSQIKHLQNNYQSVKENEEECSINHQRIQSEIKEQTVLLTELVKNYEKFLLEKADKIHKNTMKHLDNQEQAMAAHISALTSALNFTKMLRQYGTDEEKVSLRKMVGKCLQELCDEQVQYEVNKVMSWTLQKPKVSLQHIRKIYGNLQAETTLNDVNQKVNIGEICTEDAGSNSSEKDKLTNKRKTLMEDSRNECLPVCEPIWETSLPSEISQYCIKGIGINSIGNLVIGASLINRQAVYIVDGHCGKVMDKYIVNDGWTLHTITPTGKGVLYLARGHSKFKVKIMECSDGFKHLQETQIECVGINTITVDAKNQLIVTANRYIDDSEFGGKSIKTDTNITVFDSQTGAVQKRLTHQMYKAQNIDILQQPDYLLSSTNGDLLLADSGSQSVTKLTSEGRVIFNYKVSEVPNILCIEKGGNILVGDRHEKKITVLTKNGQAKSFLLTEIPKFFVIGKDNNLLVLDSLGTIKHFKYRQIFKS